MVVGSGKPLVKAKTQDKKFGLCLSSYNFVFDFYFRKGGE